MSVLWKSFIFVWIIFCFFSCQHGLCCDQWNWENLVEFKATTLLKIIRQEEISFYEVIFAASYCLSHSLNTTMTNSSKVINSYCLSHSLNTTMTNSFKIEYNFNLYFWVQHITLRNPNLLRFRNSFLLLFWLFVGL